MASNDMPMETEPDMSALDPEITATNMEAELSRKIDNMMPVKLGLVSEHKLEEEKTEPEIEELLTEVPLCRW